MLQLIRENSDMDQERQEWFMRENQKKQYEWSNQIEQNILKQQLALEEKLAKQEALVQQTVSFCYVKESTQFLCWGALKVMVIVVENGVGDLSSNPGRVHLLFTSH